MHRLLVPSSALSLSRVTLPDAAARHLKVLRPKPNEEIELFDGQGHLRTYAYSQSGLVAAGEIVSVPPLAMRLTLFACVTKGSRWDWTIEKAVELGVARIVPVISKRCIVRLTAAERPAKAQRWRRIAEDAARQSDAAWLPEVLEAVDFPAALEQVKACRRVFVGALAEPPPPPLWTAISDCEDALAEGDYGLFVGPEGDFTPEELAALVVLATPVSFGPTVLRAETAAIFGLSVLAAASHSRANFYAATLGGGRSRGACTAGASELLCSDRLVGTVLSIK